MFEEEALQSLKTRDFGAVYQQGFREGPGVVVLATEFVQALCLQPPTHTRPFNAQIPTSQPFPAINRGILLTPVLLAFSACTNVPCT